MKIIIREGMNVFKTDKGKIKFFKSKNTARKFLFEKGYEENDIGKTIQLITYF